MDVYVVTRGDFDDDPGAGRVVGVYETFSAANYAACVAMRPGAMEDDKWHLESFSPPEAQRLDETHDASWGTGGGLWVKINRHAVGREGEHPVPYIIHGTLEAPP